MQHIIGCLKYEDTKPLIAKTIYLHGSDKIVMNGLIDIQAFGSVKMNGVTIQGNYRFRADNKLTFEIMPDSGLMFNTVNEVVLHPIELDGVPPVPELVDPATLQIQQVLQQMLDKLGIQMPEGDDMNLSHIDEDFDDDEFNQYMVDTDSLVETDDDPVTVEVTESNESLPPAEPSFDKNDETDDPES